MKRIWWWLLDEWCAMSVKTFSGEFEIEYKDRLPYVVPR